MLGVTGSPAVHESRHPSNVFEPPALVLWWPPVTHHSCSFIISLCLEIFALILSLQTIAPYESHSKYQQNESMRLMMAADKM